MENRINKIIDTEERIYPLGKASSHLLGYIQGISEEELKEDTVLEDLKLIYSKTHNRNDFIKMAEEYLEKNNYKILKRNFLICQKLLLK